MLRIKRVYEPTATSDGFRILVDRLWPRGLSKENAHIDLWFREIAPSNELRIWYKHDPAKWPEFQKRYLQELEQHPEKVEKLKQLVREHDTITLVYGAKVPDVNHAVVLAQMLKHS